MSRVLTKMVNSIIIQMFVKEQRKGVAATESEGKALSSQNESENSSQKEDENGKRKRQARGNDVF